MSNKTYALCSKILVATLSGFILYHEHIWNGFIVFAFLFTAYVESVDKK